MSEIMPYIWLGIIIFAAVAEIYTYALVSVWCIPSALASFVLSLIEFQVWIQAAVFFIITFILLVLSKTIFRNFIKSKKNISSTPNENLTSLIGKSAIVLQEINNYKTTGIIRAGSVECAAKSDDDDIIYERGLVVTIIEIDGITAICSR